MARPWASLYAVCVLPLIVALACPIASAADESGEASACFDAVLVARLLRQTPTPFPEAGPGEIVMRWPWVLTVEPERVLYSRVPVPGHPFDIGTVQHTSMRHDIEHLLIFLRRSKQGFRAQWVDVYVTRDEKGRFVRPLPQPPDEQSTFPSFWIPSDYAAHLVSVRYRTRAAWWQRADYDGDGNVIPLSSKPKWVHEQGLVLASLQSLIAWQAGQRCKE
jgi:hypothetical protein